MSKKIKIILGSLFGLFIVLFAGIFFYVSSKITPDRVRQMVATQVQNVFPNSEVVVGKVDIGVGLSISVDVEKFAIKSKNTKEDDLFSVNDLKVKIPIWAILTGGGKVVLSLDKPDVYYAETATSNNWQIAMGANAAPKENTATSGGQESSSTSPPISKEAIPAILYKMNLDFKLQDMSVKYLLKDSQKGQLKISKFLIKGLNLTGPTAFELDSDFKANLEKHKQLTFKTLVIGQFNLSEYLKDRSISALMMVNLTGVKANWAEYQIPDSKTELKLKLFPSGDVDGNVNFSFNGRNSFESHFNVKKDKTLLSGIKSELYMQDLISMANMKDVTVKAGESKFTLEGEVESLPQKLLPRVKFKIAPDLLVDGQDFNMKASMDGFWKDSQFEVGALVKLFDGQIDVTSRGKYLIEKKEGQKFVLPPLDVDVRLSDLKITKEYIQKTLYSPKVVNAKVESSSAGEADESTPAETATKVGGKEAVAANQGPGISAKVLLNFNRIKIDKEDLSGKGKLVIAPNKIDLEKLDFSFTGGTGSITQSTKIAPTTTYTNFNLGLNKINMKGFNAFLPASLKSIEGIFSGTVNGAVEKKVNAMKYDVSLNVAANKGEIKGLNLTEKVQGLLGSIPLLKDKIDSAKNYEVSSNFETLNVKGNFKQDVYSIEKFEFIGMDKKVEMKGGGKVFPPPEKQSADLTVDFLDNTGKISALLEKNVGTKVLPMKLVGEGFSLHPDYGYTIGKLAKSGFETKAKAKIQEKAMEKVQDALGDKIKKQGVDKIFKGLFK